MASGTGVYEILLKIGKNVINEIQHLSIVRMPLQKNASFILCKVNLVPMHVKALQNLASSNKFSECMLEVWSVSRDQKKQVSPVSTKRYLIVSAQPDNCDNVDDQKAQQSMMLVLAHPVLYEMSTRNQYNTKHDDMTCMDAIKQYESKIKEYYGDCFNINRIGENTQKNDFKYEEQLIKSPNDLEVPKLLNGMYKCYHSFNLFFFDCFHINQKAEKDITIHHLNFYNDKDFKKFDVSERTDITYFAAPGKETPFVDINRDYNFISDPNITYITSNNEFIHIKQQTGTSKTYSSKDGKEQKFSDDRKYKVSKTNSSQNKTVQRATQFLTVEVPETTTDNAKKRMDCIKNTKIDTLKMFTFQNCMPDFPNFGEIYNLELDNVSEYLYTPIGIVNNFVRESKTEPYCKHYSQVNFIKYKGKSDSD